MKYLKIRTLLSYIKNVKNVTKNSNINKGGIIMADSTLFRESKEILKQMGATQNKDIYFCSILRVLQMRHSDLDMHQARRVIKRTLHD